MSESSPTEVVDQPERSRYVLTAGGEEVGFSAYLDRDGLRVFTHTEVDPAHGGKGYGSILAKGVLDAVRAAGLKAVPLCPFIAAYVQKHPDYDDILEPASIELRRSLG